MKKLVLVYVATIMGLVLLFAVPLPYYLVLPGSIHSMEQYVQPHDKPGHFSAVSVRLYYNPYPKLLGLTDNAYRINAFIYGVNLFTTNTRIVGVWDQQTTEETDKQLSGNPLNVLRSTEPYSNSSQLLQVRSPGASADLILALEVIHQTGNQDLVRGRRIAGTGELDSQGNVLLIGGIEQKLRVAQDAGVDIFMMPKGQVIESNSMRIISVQNLSEAVEQLSR